MSVARVRVTPELLIEALRFPDGTRVVKVGIDTTGHIELTLSHQDIRVIESDADALPPVIKPLFRKSAELDAHSAIFVGWGQG